MMIYIITAVHNRIKTTEKFVKMIMNQDDFSEIRLVLVDDGSTDGTEDKVKALLPSSVILRGNGSLFWGGAMHLAYQYLKRIIDDDDVVFYSNDDVMFSNDYITRAVSILQKRKNDLLSGYGYRKNTGECIDGALIHDFSKGDIVSYVPVEEGNCTSTRSLFMFGKTYKDIGGFHPVLLPHYGSDYEYTIRAYRKGHKIFSDASLQYISYLNAQTSKKKLMSRGNVSNPIYRLIYYIIITPITKMPSLLYNKMRNT